MMEVVDFPPASTTLTTSSSPCSNKRSITETLFAERKRDLIKSLMDEMVFVLARSSVKDVEQVYLAIASLSAASTLVHDSRSSFAGEETKDDNDDNDETMNSTNPIGTSSMPPQLKDLFESDQLQKLFLQTSQQLAPKLSLYFVSNDTNNKPEDTAGPSRAASFMPTEDAAASTRTSTSSGTSLATATATTTATTTTSFTAATTVSGNINSSSNGSNSSPAGFNSSNSFETIPMDDDEDEQSSCFITPSPQQPQQPQQLVPTNNEQSSSYNPNNYNNNNNYNNYNYNYCDTDSADVSLSSNEDDDDAYRPTTPVRCSTVPSSYQPSVSPISYADSSSCSTAFLSWSEDRFAQSAAAAASPAPSSPSLNHSSSLHTSDQLPKLPRRCNSPTNAMPSSVTVRLQQQQQQTKEHRQPISKERSATTTLSTSDSKSTTFSFAQLPTPPFAVLQIDNKDHSENCDAPAITASIIMPQVSQDEEDALRTISTTTTIPQNTEKTRRITFSHVNVRYYERTVSDHPCVSDGPPIGLGWNWEGESRQALPPSYDDYDSSSDDDDDMDICNYGYDDVDEEDDGERSCCSTGRGNNRRASSSSSSRNFLLSRRKREQLLKEWQCSHREVVSMIRLARKTKNQRRATINNLKAEPMERVVETAKRKLRQFVGKRSGSSRRT